MYFEDEKENMTDTGALDDLDLDMDLDSGDDKAVTWDDLLDDDADIDLSSVKKGGNLDDEALLDTSGDDDDMSLLGDTADTVQDIRPRQTPRKRTAPTRQDAFDVFGGSGTGTDDDIYGNTTGGDTITPDLTHRASARTKAGFDDNDDIYFEPRKASKSSSSFFPALVGILVAVLIVAGGVWWFMTSGKSPVAGLDANSLVNNNKANEEQLIPDVNQDKPVIDINASAETNAANNEKKAEEKKAEDKKKEEQKFVTFAVQNGGRINPFVPPSGFEAAKYTVASDYEILSPPEEVPGEEVSDSAKKLMDIVVTGILFDSVKPSAIISVNGSDFYVQIGDKVDECQVIAINKQFVAIKDGTNIYKAQVGESFGSASNVSGMAKSQVGGKYAGARQYTSEAEVEVSARR